MPKKAIGARVKFPGRNAVEPSYLSVKFFRVGSGVFLDYLDVRIDREADIFRYRPIVTGSFGGDVLVEMRCIDGGGEMSEREGV